MPHPANLLMRSGTVGDDQGPSPAAGGALPSPEEAPRTRPDARRDEARRFYELIDTDASGSISKLEIVDAVYRDPSIAAFVLQGLDRRDPLSDEQVFDAVDTVFDSMGGGRHRVRYADFEAYFLKAATEKTTNTTHMRAMFSLIDHDGNGSISKLELVGAVYHNPTVANFLLPGVDSRNIMKDEQSFDALNSLFEAISGGKKRFDYLDFEKYFRKTSRPQRPEASSHVDRSRLRVLVIGPGFGLDLNPRQGAILEQAYRGNVRWCLDLPEPDHFGSNVRAHLPRLRQDIEEFRPHVVVGASSGGVYLMALWSARYWLGPTVMINAHTSLTRLPAGVPIAIAHGCNDERYRRSRAELRQLVSTGSPNKCFLYYTANSGELAPGHFTRMGDRHVMESLLQFDCLPRLIDAVASAEGPEAGMVRTYRARLSDERQAAEHFLGFSTQQLRRFWASPGRKGADDRKLFEVPRGTEEYQQVAAIFKAQAREPPAYVLSPQHHWDRVVIVRIERIENGPQETSASKYREALSRSFGAQGLDFEPGVHTTWAFHGAGNDPEALDSIIHNPVAGFQPLTCGSRNKPLWGAGAYFARDAKYVSDGLFCGPPAADGTNRMLLCLLAVGMPCVGDAGHFGLLPFRQGSTRYDSSVDSLSSPEIWAVQHPSAAYPAYMITFA